MLHFIVEKAKYIISGGPGSGKTSLIEALKKLGYRCYAESGRKIIQEQVKKNGNALPWKNKEKFRDLMLLEDLKTYHNDSSELSFFDRGILDLLAYSRLAELKVPRKLLQAIEECPYHKKMFIAPPWEEIYCVDEERKQDFQEALETYRQIRKIYMEFSYELIELPKVGIAERALFVLDHCCVH